MAARKKKEEGQTAPVKGKQKRTKKIPDSERASGTRRRTTHHKFTPAARQRYLDNLAEWGTKNRSADAAGVSYRTVQNYLALHPEFQLDVDDALEKYRDMLLNEMKARAVTGYEEAPIFGKDGEILGYKIKKSDRLLEVALKRVDPESRETIQKIEHKGTMTTASVPFDVKLYEKFDKTEREALRTVLKAIQRVKEAKEENGTAPPE